MLVAVVLLLSLSVIAQLVAAILAVRLIRVTGRRTVWMLFLASVLLMLVNRVWALVDIAIGTPVASVISLGAAASALAISLSMAVGIALIGPIFRGLFLAREQLRRERDFASSLIQTAPTYFVAIDPAGRTLLMNNAMLRALSYDEADVVGTPYLETFVPPEEHGRVASTFGQLMSGKQASSVRNHIIARDGTRHLVQWYGAPVRNTRGEFEYFFGVGMDRTDIETLEKQLQQAQKMEAIGRLAGGIAHDFNNLLTTIQGNAEQLRRGLEPHSKAHTQAERIQQASRTAAELTRQLLVFSRKQVAASEVLSLTKVIADMEPLLTRTTGQTIDLDLQLASDTLNVRAGRANIEQVILNLVLNARDAMPEGGTLVVATANRTPTPDEAIRLLDLEPGNYVCLSVIDSGSGMTEEVQRQLFEPFFTTKTDHQGTGLGLAIVYGVVRGCGGSVKVISEPGQGARFDIYLPATSEQTTLEPTPNRPSPADGRGETVVVVEDNDGVRELACTILESAGFHVVEAADPGQAIAAVNRLELAPDLLLTDVVMPGMSGRDLAVRMKDLYPRLEVVYMSGYANSVLSERTGLPEGIHFVQKPFSTSDLLACVRDALKNSADGQKA
jgi:two-component system cell cycle sensor histidine kinase/response regulator CckA